MLKLQVVSVYFLCALVARGCCGPVENDGGKMDVFRLPDATSPEFYELRFEPNFNGINSTFTGVANIYIHASSNTDVITLNLKELDVTNVTVTDITNGKLRIVPIKEFVYVAKNEQFEIRFGSASIISKRRYSVLIYYGGMIRNDMSGLYMSSYDEGNATKWLAVTQFEPTYARSAFPCYDEPAYKAIFNISVVKQKDQIALSNMPAWYTDEKASNSTDVVYFESTPLMSSYLVAIYVGEFVANKNLSFITVYTHEEYINQTQYVSEEAPRCMEVLQNYTGIDYKLPKMDLLAIPDFSFGAMENWGLNTYREYYMLLHTESKTKMKIRATEVLQHEFTHQWFGNLVTCSWWDYTWLNEGFATYFQYFATGMIRTTWKMDELFVVEAHQGSLAYDQTPRHPITTSVNTIEEIENIFDTITYRKAASVLRMLKCCTTEYIFRKSLQSYLNDKSENVAEPLDWYSAVDNMCLDEGYTFGDGLTVYTFMSNWTTQSGYPVINVEKNEALNTFSVTQSRFLIDAADAKNDSDSAAWHIGLTYTTEASKNFSFTRPSAWTDRSSKLTVIPAPRDSGWYIFNIQSTGFYRVNYDADNWMALVKQLNETPTAIHELNRAQLIDDSFALARAGQLNYTVPLRLSKYLKNEDSTIPWYSAKNSFSYLIERMPRSAEGYVNFKAHVSKLAGTIFNKLDRLVSTGNSEFNVLSAWDAFATWACSLDNEDCTTKALEYFRQWQAGERISADIKDAAFCVGVKNSSDSGTFYKMFDLYKTTKSISEKMSAETALGCSANRTLLTEYINHILDGPYGTIKAKNYRSVISSISATPLGLDVLHEFLSTNLNRTLKELSDGEGIATYIYEILSSKMTNDSEIEKIRNLKDDSTVPLSLRSSFEKSFEKVNHNLLWFNTYSDGISKWALESKEEEEEGKTTVGPPSTSLATETTGSTNSTPTSAPKSSTTLAMSTTPKPSSATSNVHNSLIILLLTVFTVKRYIL